MSEAVILGAALAAMTGLLAWFATQLFGRLVTALDKTVDKLGVVGETQAAHGARLDALERDT